MTLSVEPGGWTFDIERSSWTWDTDEEGVTLTANGRLPADVTSYPINPYERLPSGFSIYVDGSLIYTDPTDGYGYFIFVEARGEKITSVVIRRDPIYDETSDILSMMEDL